jgi:transposase
MSQKLSEAEVNRRLIRLRNLEQLHAKAKARIAQQDVVIAELKQQMSEMKQMFEEVIERQQVRIAELEKMVFGRRPKGKDDSSSDPGAGTAGSSSKPPPSKGSHRRPIPPANQITNTQQVPVDGCHSCGSSLTGIQIHLRYVEDILLPALMEQATKTVTKLEVEQGYCAKCGTYSSGRDLRGQEVVLGPHVRLLVTYLVTLMDLTYSQVNTLIADLYGLSVDRGDIAGILATAAKGYLPEYERLKQSIRGGPGAHMDETSWKIQGEGMTGYAWAMVSSTSDDVVFLAADGRGKGNAQSLYGKDYRGIRITDCYGAYKNLPGLHQVCWAHLYRVARDLAQMEDLTDEKRAHCKLFHAELGELYETLRADLEEPFDQERRAKQRDELLLRVDELALPHALDPKKLADLKRRLVTYRHALFTCLMHEGIPADNNKAERHLRKLVIKRKKSFGSKTLAGAHNLAVLMSVAWSTWYRDRTHFFPTMLKLASLG